MCRTVGTKIPSESPSQVSLFTVCLATVKRSRNFVQRSIRLQPSSQVDGNCSASSLNRPTNSARRPKIIETATKKVGTFFIFCRPLPNERIFHRRDAHFPFISCLLGRSVAADCAAAADSAARKRRATSLIPPKRNHPHNSLQHEVVTFRIPQPNEPT